MNNLEKVTLLAVFIFLFLFLTLLFAQKSVSTIVSDLPVELSPQERAWLKAHPEIVLGYTDAFEPDVIVNPDGSLRGIQVDFLAELNRRLGTRIGLKIYPIPELLEKAQKSEVDGIISLHPEFADKLGLLETRTHFVNYPAVFSRKDVSFNNPSDLTGKRVAIIDNVFFSEQIIERYGKGAKILKVQDAEEGLQIIDNGQADYFLGASLNAYLITKYQLFNLATQYIFYNNPINGVIGTRSDWPELSAILDKGLSSFSRYEFEAIMVKWSHLSEQPMGLSLSDTENTWLAQNHVVRVRVVDHPPFMILDKGRTRGISIDYLEYIARYTGINFQYFEEIRPFDQAYQSMKNLQGPDLIQSSQVKAEQMAEDLFSNVYFSVPYVIYMRNNADFISGIEGLAGKTISIPGDSLLYKQLLAQVSDSSLLIFDSDYEALIALSTGKVDAYVGNVTEASYYIQEYNISNLKIAAPSLLKDEVFSFGIRPDWPELATIIDKTLDNMSSEDRAAIRNKYVAIRFEHGIDISELQQWGGAVLVVTLSIILIILYWNRSLRKLVAIRTVTLTESEARFRATFEQGAVGIAHVSPEGRFLRINQKFCQITGYSMEEMLSKTFQDITHAEDLNRNLENVGKLLSGEIPNYTIDKRYIRKDGTLVWINLTVSLVRDEQQGRPEWFVAMVKDITERKQGELELAKFDEALKESEEKFRNLMEQSPISIQIHTPDGRLLQSNAAYARLYALNEQILEELYEKYNVLEDKQARNLGIMPYIEKVFAGEDAVFPDYMYDGVDTLKTLDFKNPVSRKVWIQTRGYPIKNKDGKIVNAVFMSEDITDRRVAEEALKESEEKFRHLVEQSPFSIQIFNTDGYLDQVNEAFMKLWGVTEESLPELLGKYNVLEDEEARRLGISKAIKRAFKGDFVTLPLIEYDAVSTFTDIGMSREGGNKRWILPRLYPLKNARGEVMQVVNMEEDITERKYAEEKYRVLVEQAQDGIIIIRDGKIIFVNPYLAKQQGYTESEILNTPFTDYIFPDEIEKVREIYQLRMAGKPAPMVYESALKSKDGSRLEVEFNAAVIIYEGKPADLVFVRDISDRKQVEKEFQQYHGRLKSLAAQLTLAEEKERRRIATDLHDQIGQLLASSRFQLAAMINKIDDPVLSEKLQNVSGNLRLAVEDTRHIISDLSSPLLNELGFEAAISEWLEENVQNRFDIKTSLSCNTRQIDLEEDVSLMLYRSVRELLTNVIKHARATKVEVVIESDKEILKLMVRDNGIGFNYNLQQLNLKGESSLGLFSIRERMFDLGGEMEVNTAKLKGTEITLIVPLSKKRKSSK